jgi:hypothetical protein
MQTAFARWLAERGEAHHAFAFRYGLYKEGVARLAGIGRQPYKIRYFKRSLLALVSAETGIPVETLIEDATRAAQNPTPPRRYNRKGMGDGKRTEAAE